jgi:N-methylhydantoinase A
MKYRISCDVGGTFTDLTIADTETFLQLGRHKSPTTPEDRSNGVMNCMQLAADELGLSLNELLSKTSVFCHGSTTATNAILDMSGAKTGLICTKGTKYNLWRGEGRRKTMFNYKMEPNRPLLRPYLCLEVEERISSEGKLVIPLNEKDVRTAVRQLKEWNVETIAVCTLWSIVSNKHEKRIGQIIEEEWPGVYYCLSADIQPIIREYDRTSCVVLNAMLQPIVTRYLENLEKRLEDNGFTGEMLIVVSNGGVLPFSEVVKKPVFMLFSGPSMAPAAGYYFSELDGDKSCITLDMGGTSFDVSTVVDGQITTTHDGRVLRYPTGVASIEIMTLGAGGGSIAWIDKAGLIGVGPRSAEAVPGPACYMRGGIEPTVTDAYVVLGYITPKHFLNGRMEIDAGLAREVIEEKIAKPMGITTEKAAFGISQVVNENMIGGILDMTIRRGLDPREFSIITGGGATSVPVGFLAKEMGVKKVIIARETSVLCAFGANNAAIAMSDVASKYANSENFDFDGVNDVLASIGEKGNAFLERMDVPPTAREFEFFCSARYPMQATELEIPLVFEGDAITQDNLASIIEYFHDAYLKRYKTNDRASNVEFLMWRHMATYRRPQITLQEQGVNSTPASSTILSCHPAYFGGDEFVDTPVYDGERLTYGMLIDGPGIVVLPDTTIVVPPDFKLSTRKHGYFVMDLDV